jgi:RNA polymerase sigma-70 factor, ECF subfamily
VERRQEPPSLLGDTSGEITASISRPFSDRKADEEARRPDERTAVLPLVEDAQKGNRDAFGVLYRLFNRRVHGLARFYLGEGAEDAVAETFMRAWAALPRYRPTGVPFVAWLYGIARHVVTDELRSRKRTESRHELRETSIDPQHDDRLALASSIERLPKQQRRVVEMKYLLGMTNPEVAGALGKSIGAVNALQWRALQTLKELMEQE